MTRGFITIATGKEMYYQLARNLLQSYKLYCDAPYPFAIMCDRENEYTSLFDCVIVLENAQKNYFDKFELLIHSPYDETIFIDSDCLAYADLNHYWDYFSGADDFSAGGYNFPINSPDGLFWADSIGDYKNRIKWKPSIHGGLYFIRRGKKCDAIYAEYQNIMRHYSEYQWPDYCVDEPIFGLAMAAHDCRAIEEDPANYIYPWLTITLKCDILSGKCSYVTNEHIIVEQGRMIHWSVRNCQKPLYRFEVEKLNLMLKNNLRPDKNGVSLNLLDTLLYKYKLRYDYLCLKDFMIRAVRKLFRILGFRR
ncbi:MAG: hypothetical protein Q4D50_06795 [Eubacteriales bacterium]|nr:hypothetical protein [Eubacteriales bacterium]